jgi:hypothetical protein
MAMMDMMHDEAFREWGFWNLESGWDAILGLELGFWICDGELAVALER